MVNNTTMTSKTPFPTLMHKKMCSIGRSVDEISDFLFTVTDGGHFGFYALEISASLFKRESNVTYRTLVTESWFWTLLYAYWLSGICPVIFWRFSAFPAKPKMAAKILCRSLELEPLPGFVLCMV